MSPNPAWVNKATAAFTSSEFVRWGGGIVQEIDAAAMSVWLKYRQHEAQAGGGTLRQLDDARFLGFGALINF